MSVPDPLQAPLEQLCASVPEAVGVVLCDFEGETVVTRLGAGAPPAAAALRAQDHVPKTLAMQMPVAEFLMRLAAAEPCAPLRHFAACTQASGFGKVSGMEARYADVEVLTECLPEDFYLVLVLRRPSLSFRARRHLQRAAHQLAPQLA